MNGNSEAQSKALRLAGVPSLKNLAEARKFMASVGICLRYWETPSLPIASMYRAIAGKEKRETALPRAVDLSNQLLGTAEVVEVNVIAERLCFVHNSLMPALYKLVTRNKYPKLSLHAKHIVKLLEDKGQIASGDVRKLLGVSSGQRIDPAYEALAELQRNLIVDRGPFKRPEKGIPYLPKEGYPYHLFHEAHYDLVTEAEKLSLEAASEIFLLGYLQGALFCSIKKMPSMFKALLSEKEVVAAVERLEKNKRASLFMDGKKWMVTIGNASAS